MSIESIVTGSEEFKQGAFNQYEDLFSDLTTNGQHPKALFISCCDSRVMPNFFTSTGPGELFVVRNIGNLVHPYNIDEEFHSTAAAIEYALVALKIQNIIVCGHSQCGAMGALYTPENLENKELIHVKKWIKLANGAKEFVEKNIPADEPKESIINKTAKISAIFQLDNLLTYPQVKERVDKGELTLHAWFYQIENGEIQYYNGKEHDFLPLNK